MEDSEKSKVFELLKEMRSESNIEENTTGTNGSRLSWMYKGPSELVDREEYLLGKAIDKSFELLNNASTADACLGRSSEQSNVPKRLLEKTDNTEQVDIAKKILEDPLYAIRQKELEARKKLLNNPVKLKQIKQMLLERDKNITKRKKKKGKSKKSSTKDLEVKILNKLTKFSEKEKKKALNYVLKSDSDSSSSDSSDSHKNSSKRVKKKLKKSSKETDSDSSETDDDAKNDKYSKKKKRASESKERETVKRSKYSNSSHFESSKRKDKSPKYKKNVLDRNHGKKSSSKNLCQSSSSDISSSTESSSTTSDSDTDDSEEEKKLDKKSKKSNSYSSKLHEPNNKNPSKTEQLTENLRKRGRKDRYYEKPSHDKRNYGLMMPDGSKPKTGKNFSSVEKYEKPVENKTKYVPEKVKHLTEKEKEDKLKEMMKDAKLRKQDREKNLAFHRKKQSNEENVKTYDSDFVRRQMSHLTSQGTMADRIKSNINNIQRSKSSMDSSFMRK